MAAKTRRLGRGLRRRTSLPHAVIAEAASGLGEKRRVAAGVVVAEPFQLASTERTERVGALAHRQDVAAVEFFDTRKVARIEAGFGEHPVPLRRVVEMAVGKFGQRVSEGQQWQGWRIRA